MTTAWFKEWFDTDFYHLLYERRDTEEAKGFLDKLVSFLDLPDGARIIDIGCGRGRHSIYLNELGYDVTGIDLANRSILTAKESENEHLHFHRHDNRQVFRMAYFDAAFVLFTSFGYLETREDLLDQLNKMKQNLRRNGLFVLDYFNSSLIQECRFEDVNLVKQGIEFNIKKEIHGHQVVKTIEVRKDGKKEHFKEKVHLITKDEFRELFQEAGLEILHIFGNYMLEEYDQSNSERLIIIAQNRS